MRRLVLLTIVILLTFTLVVIAWRLNRVLLVFLASLAVAATLNAPVEWLVQRGFSRTLAILTTYAAIILLLFGLLAAIFIPIAAEVDPLAQALVGVYGTIQNNLAGLANPRTAWVSRLPTAEQIALSLAGGQTAAVLSTLLGATQNMGRLLSELAIAVVLAIYWTADGNRFERLWLSILPADLRMRARRVWRRLETDVGAHIRSEFLQTIAAVALFAGGYLGLGIGYPFTLALAAGLLWLVPLLGGFLAVLAVIAVGLLAGPAEAVLGAAYTIVVLAVLEFIVQRRIYRGGRYWGMLLILMMLALIDALGPIGLILAPPIALAVQIMLDEVLNTPTPAPAPVPVVDIAALRTRLEEVRARVGQGENRPSPRLVNLVDRLDNLVIEVESTGAYEEAIQSSHETTVYQQNVAVGLAKEHI
jgi:predicted PurR-regulated permease PerM